MKSVGVLILNYNGASWIGECLKSLNIQTSTDFDVYFIDNGSDDNSVNLAKSVIKNIKIIQLKKNYGYTKGYNLGFKYLEKLKVKYKYYLLLGNDVICQKDNVECLLKIIEKDEKIGVVSPTVLDRNKNIDLCGGTMSLFSGRPNGFKHNQKYKKSNKIFRCFWICTCCTLIKSDLLKSIKYNDDYYGYFDDVGISWKLFNKNYLALSTMNTAAIHLGSMSFKKIQTKKVYLLERNRIIMFWQNLTTLSFIVLIPLVVISRIFCLIGLFLLRKYNLGHLYYSFLGIKDSFIEMKKFEKYNRYFSNDIRVLLNSTKIYPYKNL